jgi:hypothetical protein
MTEKIKKKVCHVALRISPDMFRWIKDRAEASDTSYSAVVRRIVATEMRSERKEKSA